MKSEGPGDARLGAAALISGLGLDDEDPPPKKAKRGFEGGLLAVFTLGSLFTALIVGLPPPPKGESLIVPLALAFVAGGLGAGNLDGSGVGLSVALGASAFTLGVDVWTRARPKKELFGASPFWGVGFGVEAEVGVMTLGF